MTEAIHLRPTAPLAERVLLPGDPHRALAVAQAILDEPRMFNHTRGLWGYTGRARDGEPLTIQATGMGAPSAAIVVRELIDLGARTLVRIGTCGALDEGLELGALVTAGDALAADGTTRALGAGNRLPADPELMEALCRAGAEPVTAVTSDLFYDDGAHWDDWVAAGARVVEMEASAILAVAARHGVRAGILLGVTDHLAEGGRDRIPATSTSAWGSASARRPGRRWRELACFGDGEALLGPRHGVSHGCHRLAELGQVGGDLLQSLAQVLRAAVAALARGRGSRRRLVLEPVQRVLDALQPLGHRPQPAGQPLDVRSGRQVQRTHRRFLGQHGLLTRLESTSDRAADHRIGDQLLGQAPERLLSLARHPVDEALVCTVLGHRWQGIGTGGPGPASPTSRKTLILMLSLILGDRGHFALRRVLCSDEAVMQIGA